MPGGDLPGALQVRIKDRGQSGALGLGVLARMVAAENTGPDHAAPQDLVHSLLRKPRLRLAFRACRRHHGVSYRPAAPPPHQDI